MTRRSKPSLLLPMLALALLATGFAGCKNDEQQAESVMQDQEQTATQEPGAAAAPGTPAAPGTAPAPGQQAAATPPLDPNQIPAVVARVNGQEIKKAELMEHAQQMRQQLAQMAGVQAPLNSDFYKEVLDGMVAHQLLIQEAKSMGLSVTDAEIDQQLNEIKSRFPDAATFQKELAQRKVTEAEIRDEMRRSGTVEKLIQAKIAPSVQVSEAQAREFYEKNQDKMTQPERRHLRHILVAVPPQAPAADRQKAREKAESVLLQARNGADFAQLAAENSDDPGSKTRGGDLSWVTPGQMVPAFEKAGFALQKPNDLSPVVETRFGYHIIQLLERQEGQRMPFEAVKGQINQMLRQRQGQERLRAHVQELKAKGKVETFI